MCGSFQQFWVVVSSNLRPIAVDHRGGDFGVKSVDQKTVGFFIDFKEMVYIIVVTMHVDKASHIYIYNGMYVIYYDIIVSSCILTFCSTVAVMRLIGY